MEKMIDPDYICYPTIVAFIEGVGIPKQNIEYLAYLEPCFSLDGVEIEKNEDGYVLRESEAVGHVLGEIEAVGPLYEDTNFVGPVLGERDYGDNIGSEKVGRSVNANSNDIITDTVESDEDDDSESEDLSVERWLSDEDDEEISQIFNNKRKFKSRNLGDEHQEAQPKRTATDSQGKEASVEDESSDTDYIESDDPGSYKTYFEGELCVKKGKKLFFDDKGEVPRIELGIIFENPKQFKEALGAYAVAKRFDFRRANYRFVGKHFLSKLKILSNLKLKDMMRLAKDELKVELNKNLCQRARVWANQKISGRLEDEFKKLFDYVYTLREVDPNGDFKGEILVVVGRDGNNQIFPVAWPVVEVENREKWAWFLEHIQIDLEIGDEDRFTILSDMQKSQQTHKSTSLQLAVIDVSQPPALNPSQPTTTDVSQPPAPNPSQPTTSQASQPQFPNSRNTSTRTKSKASYGR
ncbi:hypothetical protein V6N11_001833 [Hibiscus sabdariffa]|uniref:Transposase, MuDR, MULE transposase domain protein n=1 Tax=Hibiscus sabdariffa TaxID=183260 RepID=A0ABR2QTM9_9ROSI